MPGPLVTERPPDSGGDARPPLVLRSRAALSPAALVAVCGVLAAALLAAAAGATHGTPSGNGHAASWANRAAVDVIAMVEVLTVLAAIAIIVLMIMSGGLPAGAESRPSRRRSWKQLIAFAACVAIALALARTTPHAREQTTPPVPAPLVGPPPLPSAHGGKPAPSPDWWLVFMLLGLAGAAVVLASWQTSIRRRRRPSTGGPSGAHESGPTSDALGSAVRAGLRDLDTETDPRRAVILSYGAMETSLAEAGFGRRRSEAPIEYLSRVLAGGGVSPDAVTELTELFERAGFSARLVADDERQRARDALRRVEDELSVSGPTNQ